MSNSPLATCRSISPNRTSPRNHVIDTISIHCAVGQLKAESIVNMKHFKTYDAKKGSSCNYAIGFDGSIAIGVDECDRSWCTSDRANDHRSITIEVASDLNHPYAVTDAAYKALIDLLVDICRRNNIKELKWKADKSLIGQVDKQNMTVHRWFANKSCPGDYLYYRHGAIANEVNARLKSGGEDDEDMDVKRFAELMGKYRDTLRDNDAGNYSKEAREWATSSGLIVGNGTDINGEPNGMWEDMLTREQLVTVLYRFAKMIGKA